jgi:hypothetical protein
MRIEILPRPQRSLSVRAPALASKMVMIIKHHQTMNAQVLWDHRVWKAINIKKLSKIIKICPTLSNHQQFWNDPLFQIPVRPKTKPRHARRILEGFPLRAAELNCGRFTKKMDLSLALLSR